MIPSVLSIIASIIIAKKLPESPRWLEAQEELTKQTQSLQRLKKKLKRQQETASACNRRAERSKTASVLGSV